MWGTEDLKVSKQLNDEEFQKLLTFNTQVEYMGLPKDNSVVVGVQKFAFSLLMRHLGQKEHFILTFSKVQILDQPGDAESYCTGVMAVDEIRRLSKWIMSNEPQARRPPDCTNSLTAHHERLQIHRRTPT